ncbi:hypothetical protein T02_12821 [Trichinella nativa]|uniref:Uncharacterized protein n=2 Tax=Trichinella TaxID=6333 RepID=A0A0V1LPE6_9BILA|nr:hypothetical protein T05_1854 [Trichinella murrelli]KRZ61365.1 hypothetical protein T02_12821 [Trichinella nativa]
MVDSEESEPTRFVKEGRTGRGRKRSRQKSPRQRSDGIALANKPPASAYKSGGIGFEPNSE